MRCTVLLFMLSITSLVYSQAPNYASLAGLQFESSSLTPVIVSPNDGVMVPLRNTPASSDHFMSGNSTIDRAGQRYFYIRGIGSSQLITVDLTTGHRSIMSIQSPIGGQIPICGIQYNPTDGKIYGLNMKDNQLRLMKLSPGSGQMTVVTTNAISPDIFSAGDATLDTQTGDYYYVRGHGYSQLVKVNVYTGLVTKKTVSNPNNAISPILNLQFNTADQTLYGLNFKSGELRLAKVNTTNGQVTLISTNAVSPDHFEQGNCALDSENGLFHYVRGVGSIRYLISVNLQTGLGVKYQYLSATQGSQALVNIEYLGTSVPSARFKADTECNSFLASFRNQSLGKDYFWDFGDGNVSTSRNPVYQYASLGTYTVMSVASVGSTSDTAYQLVEIDAPLSFTLGNDTVMIPGDTIVLAAPGNSGPYMWSTGATDSVLKVTTPGLYTCEINRNGCPSQAVINIDTAIYFTVAAGSQTNASAFVNDTLRVFVDLKSIADSIVRLTYTLDHHAGAPFYLGHETSLGLHETIPGSLELNPQETGRFAISYSGESTFSSHVVLTIFNEYGLEINKVDLIGNVSEPLNTSQVYKDELIIPNPMRSGSRLVIESPKTYRFLNLAGQVVGHGQLIDLMAPEVRGLYILDVQGDKPRRILVN